MSTDIELRDKEVHQTKLKEYALLVPRLIKLLWRLTRDPRVPARSKATLVILMGYIVSPVDVIPDVFPAVGLFDELIITAFVLDQMLNRVDADVVREHWDGDQDILEVVQEVLDIATVYVPGWVKKRFGSKKG